MALKEITFPLTVDKIQFSKTPAFLDKCVLGGKCGDFVAVRPCAKEYQGKTYLGILLGEIAESTLVQYDDARVLSIEPSLHNPIIFNVLSASWFSRILLTGTMHVKQKEKLYSGAGYPTNETIATILWSGMMYQTGQLFP